MKLLIVDDEANLLYSLTKALQSDALKVITAETAKDGIRRVRIDRPDAVIVDVRLPDMSGLDAFVEIRKIDPRLPVIVVTAYTTTETAIEAMKRGAYEYLLKPVELNQLREVVDRALAVSHMSHVPALFQDQDEPAEADLIVGRSQPMQEVYKAVGRVAPQDVPVLVLGESGTGKEMVARAIYHHSGRSHGPFLALNCAAIPDTLLESELFGYERGAFTGAERRRIGKFEQVDGGTLFLDEIADMSAATQAKFLRLLQDGTFERLGSNTTLRADVRVIAATNKNLEEMVARGEFRRDLFYRLNVFAIRLPPLRERCEDLPLLVEYFLKLFNRELGKRVYGISPDAMTVIQDYEWPGNVRELQSTLKFALLHAAGETITPDCLPECCLKHNKSALATLPTHPNLDGIVEFAQQLLDRCESDLYRKLHTEVDRVVLQRVLNYVEGNQAVAAQILGISRSTLRARIADLGLAFEKRVLPESAAGEGESTATAT